MGAFIRTIDQNPQRLLETQRIFKCCFDHASIPFSSNLLYLLCLKNLISIRTSCQTIALFLIFLLYLKSLNGLDFKTASTIATSIVHSKLDYCNSL